MHQRSMCLHLLLACGVVGSPFCVILSEHLADLLAHVSKQKIPYGNVDSEHILPSLQRSYLNHLLIHNGSVILDVGANAGATSWSYMQAFTAWPHSRNLSYSLADLQYHKNLIRSRELFEAYVNVRVHAFEPVQDTFTELAGAAIRHGWDNAGFSAWRMAVGSVNGKRSIYYDNEADPTRVLASLSAPSSTFVLANKSGVLHHHDVEVRTLHELSLPQNLNFTRGVFLLKIDTEGYDPHVLLGAKPLLVSHAIKWLVFEYNVNWALVAQEEEAVDTDFASYRQHERQGEEPSSHSVSSTRLSTLVSVVSWLYELGYLCYLLALDLMIPLYGGYWHPVFQSQGWSNVFCGLEGRELKSVVAHYNMNAEWAPDFTLPPC